MTSSGNLLSICGGGGSAKTGVQNRVQIFRLKNPDASTDKKDKNIFYLANDIDTGSSLTGSVNFSTDASLLASSIKSFCQIYEVLPVTDAASKVPIETKSLITFRTDFAAQESEQTCVKMVGNGTIITGGQDGVIRVWQLHLEESTSPSSVSTGTTHANNCPLLDPTEAENETKNNMGNTTTRIGPSVGAQLTKINSDRRVTIVLKAEYRGHRGRIRDIAIDGFSRNLVCTSAEDQTCHLWRLTTMSEVFRLPIDHPRLRNSLAPRTQFRAMVFHSTGSRLYVALSAPRGSNFVVSWQISSTQQTQEQSWDWTLVSLVKIDEASGPITTLALSPDDRVLTVGTSSGLVSAWCALTLTCHRKCCSRHAFAITSLVFLSQRDINPDPETQGYLLASSSADATLRTSRINYLPLESVWTQLGRRLLGFLKFCWTLGAAFILTLQTLVGVWVFQDLIVVPTRLRDSMIMEDLLSLFRKPVSTNLNHLENQDLISVVMMVLATLVCIWISHKQQRAKSLGETLRLGLWLNGLVALGLTLVACQCSSDRVNLALVLPQVDPELKASIATAVFGGFSLACLGGFSLLSLVG